MLKSLPIKVGQRCRFNINMLFSLNKWRSVNTAFLNLFAVVTIGLFSAPIVNSQITIDSITTNSGIGNNFYHLHTVSGNDRLLLVIVHNKHEEAVNKVEFGGQPLTFYNQNQHFSNKPIVEIWSMINPPIGTDTLYVEMSDGGQLDTVAIAAISYNGIKTAGPIDTVIVVQGTSSNPSISYKTQFGNFYQDFLTVNQPFVPIPDTDQVLLWSSELGGTGQTGAYGASSMAIGEDTATMNWSLGGISRWVLTAIALTADSCPATTKDEFNTISYDGNDGTIWWANDWKEIGESDGPGSGLARVVNSSLMPNPNSFRLGTILGASLNNRGVLREANLSGAGYASLSFNYMRDNYSASIPAQLEISGNGGSSWTTLQTYSNGSDASVQSSVYDITPYVSNQTQIRISTNGAFTVNNYIYFDNVQITYEFKCGQPPFLVHIDSQIVNEGEELIFAVKAFDPEGEIPQLSTSSLPPNATFTDSADGNGVFSFSPDFTQSGNYIVTFFASDGVNADTMAVSITVSNVNRAPVLAPIGDKAVDENVQLNFNLTAVDPDGTIPAFSVQSNPANSALVDSTNGTANFNFTPSYYQAGTFDVMFIASDGGLSDSEIVTITVNDVNLAPVLSPIPDTTLAEGTNISFKIYSFDPDSTICELTAENLPANALFIDENNDTGTFVFMPNYNQAGVYTVYFIASDGNLSDTDTVQITVTDASSSAIDEVMVTAIPVGFTPIVPLGTDQLLLAFNLRNYYVTSRTISSLTIRDASSGYGSFVERLMNVSSARLYLDKNGDMLLTPADSFIANRGYGSSNIIFNSVGLAIQPGSSINLLVGVNASLYPRDGDTLDIYLKHSSDIVFSTATTTTGVDSVNSFGIGVFDGMTSIQIDIVPVGLDTISPSDTMELISIIDIPRNGYAADTMQVFSLLNVGTAVGADFDSLVLYKDNGNSTFDGAPIDTRAGQLVFTGSYWTISGLSQPLSDSLNRFFVAARVSQFPTNGATYRGAIPQNGIQMKSGNDGPYDSTIYCSDTITIQTFESIEAVDIPLGGGIIFPGKGTGNVFAIKLTNSYSFTVAIDSLTLTLLASDPQGAPQFQLDSQIDSVVLHHELDGDVSGIGISDTVLGSSIVSGGIAVFEIAGLNILAFGGSVTFTAELFLDLYNSKNGNSINLALDNAARLVTSPSVAISGAFPIQNPKNYTIDAFPRAAVTVNPIPGQSLFAGQVNKVVTDFRLPGNGYAVDSLRSIRFINQGSLDERAALSRIRLFLDALGDGFTFDDRSIGAFTYRGTFWDITGLNQLIGPSGAGLFIVVDVSNSIFDGGTLDLQIPAGGVTYKSSMNGPDDLQFGNPNVHLVFPPNRVTAISIPSPSISIFPGTPDNSILTFALYNGYVGQSQTFQGVILSNSSQSIAGAVFSDFELGQISMYSDDNRNRIRDNDSLIATGTFSSGKLQFTGLNQVLPAESLSFFFVEASVPMDIIDSDSLAISVNSLTDLLFQDPVNLNGDAPVSSDGYLIVNGSISDQYELLNVQPTTLRPGDSLIPVFAFKPAINGNQTDALDIVTVSNAGDADNSDISSLSLWLDKNGDGTWQISDSLLGAFTFAAGSWTIGSLDLEIDIVNPALFVLASIDSLATNGTTFRGRIPVNGCQYFSGNDGPLDVSVTGTDEFTISASGLRVSLQPLASTYSVGQAIPVKLNAINLNLTSLDSVYGSIAAILDSSIVSPDSSFTGPVALNPGDTGIFSFFYSADSVGITNWSLQAVDIVTAESSAVLQTPLTTIQSMPNSIPVTFINSIPTAVAKGQLNVFPLSLRITHSDSSGTAASIRIDSLRIQVEDGSNNPILANSALSGVVLSSGYQTISIIDPVPSQSSFWLVFNQPVIISSGASRTFTLLVDIDSLATAANFALAITDASFIPLADNNSGQSISLSPSLIFPMKTASCRIEDPSTQLAVSSESIISPLVNFGQQNVGILQIDLRHPGAFGSSQIQLTELNFGFIDTSGSSLIASNLFENLAIIRQTTTVGDLFGNVPADSSVSITLNSPITLSPGEIVSIIINADMDSASVYNGFSLTISDSTKFVVRELSSGSPISATTDTVALAAGSAFPMFSTIAQMRQPAQPPQFCISSNLPPSVNSGADSTSLIALTFDYDVANNYSPIRLGQLALTVRDTSGTILDPDNLFDRIGYSQFAGTINYQPFVQIFGSSVIFKFQDTGVVINPGDSFQFNLISDLEADVPYEHFILQVDNSNSLVMVDATDTTNIPGVTFAAGCGSSFPFTTSLTEVFLPAGKPTFSINQYPVQLTFPGHSNLSMLDGELDYQSVTPQGQLSIYGLVGRVFKRNGSNLAPVNANAVFSLVTLQFDGVPVAADSILANDSLFFTLGLPYTMSRGETIVTTLIADISQNASLGNYVISFDDSAAFDIEDSDLGNPIVPFLSGLSYPFRSTEISVAEPDLGGSFTNYPNPFNPARGEETTIGFSLTRDAYVSIEIYTITGEFIKTIAHDEFRSAGTYQSDVWRGRNDTGLNVIPGTYFCRIHVKYDSGNEEDFKRKIAVVR